ncbi:MAG TPA: ParB/RepB/Spo0J family partition protein [Terriglobales bacterium]|nr:ParB/RepB/Spo0J family partition protein [Terriglobales bacterium]
MTTATDKRKALGRGLDSLLPGGPRVVNPSAVHNAPPPVSGTSAIAPAPAAEGVPVTEVPLDLIDNNPYQTRGIFREDELKDLAESIKASGVIQPVVVRPGKDGRYVLITGERRCRASRLAGKENIPAIVRVASDEQAAEMTIIENLQRADLNCMEQARAFARLSQEFGLTQEQIGQRVGCSRESVSNYMRLLKLPLEVQTMLLQGQLDFSMARVLLTVLDPAQIVKLAERAVKDHLSVVQLEDVVFRVNVPMDKAAEMPQARWVDPNVRAAQTELERILGVRVRIKDRKGKGKIVIEYATLEDFDRVLEMLKGKS